MCEGRVAIYFGRVGCRARCAGAQISAPRHCKSPTLARPLFTPFCRSLFGTGEIQLFALDIPFLQAPVFWPRVWFTRQHWAIKSFARTNNGSKIKYPPPCTFTFPLFYAGSKFMDQINIHSSKISLENYSPVSIFLFWNCTEGIMAMKTSMKGQVRRNKWNAAAYKVVKMDWKVRA